MKKILDTGYFNLEARHDGRTLLHMAAAKKNKAMISCLIDCGANVNATTSNSSEFHILMALIYKQ